MVVQETRQQLSRRGMGDQAGSCSCCPTDFPPSTPKTGGAAGRGGREGEGGRMMVEGEVLDPCWMRTVTCSRFTAFTGEAVCPHPQPHVA